MKQLKILYSYYFKQLFHNFTFSAQLTTLNQHCNRIKPEGKINILRPYVPFTLQLKTVNLDKKCQLTHHPCIWKTCLMWRLNYRCNRFKIALLVNLEGLFSAQLWILPMIQRKALLGGCWAFINSGPNSTYSHNKTTILDYHVNPRNMQFQDIRLESNIPSQIYREGVLLFHLVLWMKLH